MDFKTLLTRIETELDSIEEELLHEKKTETITFLIGRRWQLKEVIGWIGKIEKKSTS